MKPKIILVLGTALVAVGFSLIGPAPFFPMETVLWVTIGGLVLHGLGMSAQLVASFTDALRTCIENGFCNNLEPFGLISGLWTSAFALGAFIGPSISGMLYDNIGFRNSSMFVCAKHILVGFIITLFLILSRSSPYNQMKDDKVGNGDITSTGFPRTINNSLNESIKSARVSNISIESLEFFISYYVHISEESESVFIN